MIYFDNKQHLKRWKGKEKLKVAFTYNCCFNGDSKQTRIGISTSGQETTAAKPVAAEPSASTAQAATATETPPTTSNSSSSSQS